MIRIMSDIWSELFSSAPRRSFARGGRVFHRDDTVRSAFFVLKGAVSLVRSLADGGRLTIHRAEAGTLLAEASLFSDRYHCDGICDAPTRLAVLRRTDILRALEGRHHALQALEAASREVQALRTRLEIMRLKTLSARLDAYLDLFGRPETGGWVGTADWIGVTPEALYRELSRRRREEA